MNYTRLAILALFVSSLAPTPLAYAENELSQTLTIEEVGAFETSDREWILIKNRGSEALELQEWHFWEQETNHGINIVDDQRIIEPGATAIIAQKADIFKETYPEYTGLLFDSSWSSLSMDGELLGMRLPNGELSDETNYGPTTESHSQIRDGESWKAHPTGSSLRDAPQPSVPDSTSATEAAKTPSTSDPTATEEKTTTTPPPSFNKPTAIVTVESGQLTGAAPFTLNLNGRDSFDAHDQPLSFSWDFGDRTYTNAPNPFPHTYKNPGRYQVRLLVKNAAGETHSDAREVVVRGSDQGDAPSGAPLTSSHQISSQGISSGGGAPIYLITYVGLPPAEAPASTISTKKVTPKKTTGPEVSSEKISLEQALNEADSLLANFTEAEADEEKVKSEKKSGSKASGYSNGELSSEIEISELLPAPDTKNASPLLSEEWIELHNKGSAPVNLGNWLLADKSKLKNPFKIPDTLIIPAGGYMLFHKVDTKISLNNDTDAIVLADFTGTPIDALSYTQASKGKAYAKTENKTTGTSAWRWTEPTPGVANIATTTLQGSVKRTPGDNLGETQTVRLEDTEGVEHLLSFSADTIDPALADLAFEEGAELTVETEMGKDGNSILRSVADIRNPVAPVQPVESNTWLFTALILMSLSANGLLLYHNYRSRQKVGEAV